MTGITIEGALEHADRHINDEIIGSQMEAYILLAAEVRRLQSVLTDQGAGEAEPIAWMSVNKQGHCKGWTTEPPSAAKIEDYKIIGEQLIPLFSRPPASASAELNELLAAARYLCQYGHGDTEMRDRLRRAGKAYDALKALPPTPAKETP